MIEAIIAKKYEEIRLKRKALYDRGKIKLVRVSESKGAMVAIDADDANAVADAEEYNRLATQHVRIKR